MDGISNNKNNYKRIHSTGRVVSLNNCAQTSNVLNQLYDLSLNLPNYGSFQEVKRDYQNKVNKLDISNIELCVKPSILIDERPDERELEIVVNSKDEEKKYSLVLKRGDKKEILDYLKNTSTPSEIEKVLQKASDEFLDY